MAEIIPQATRTTKKGKVVPTTPLQKKAQQNLGAFSTAPAVPFAEAPKDDFSIAAQGRQQADQSRQLERQPATKLESLGAAIGGITRDAWIAAVAEKGNEEVDPKWDVGTVRDSFRTKYSPDLWDALEQTKNKSQYEALVANTEAEQMRQEAMGDNFWTSLGGSVIDPLGVLTGGAYLKGAVMLARAKNIGKYKALAGSALAEGATYGSIEAAKQDSLYGTVVDDKAVATTFLASSALIFGLSAATMKKATFTKAAGAIKNDSPIGQPQAKLDEASELIASGRQGLADDAAAQESKLLNEVAEPSMAAKVTDVADELTLAVPKQVEVPEGSWFTGTTGELTATRTLDEQIARQQGKGANAPEDFVGAGNYIALDPKFSDTYAKGGNIYSIEKPFENPFDLSAKGNAKIYRDLTKQAGSKSAANKLLQEQGYDAITFVDPRGNKLANMFNAKPVTFFKKGRTASTEPVTLELAPKDTALVDAGSAVNVGRQEVQKDLLIDSASDEILDIQDLAKQNIDAKRQELGDAFDYVNTKAGKFSALFSNFHRGMQSKSDVIKNFVLATAEDATGIYRAATTGTAVVKHKFNKLIRNSYSQVHTEYAAWAKRKGYQFNAGRLTGKAEEEFNAALRVEMEARDRLNGATPDEIKLADAERWSNTDPEVRRAADLLDKGNADAVDIMIKSGVEGAEGLKGRRGYVPRRLNGQKLAELARTNPKAFKAFKDGYAQRMFDSIVATQKELIAQGEKGIRLMTLSKATTISDGMVDRAIKRAAGLEQSTIALFDRAARDEIESILKAAGADEAEVRYTFNLLDKRLGRGTSSNRLKGRIDIDIHTPDPSGINFTEFYDNDLSRLFSSYSEEISGRAALARVGIKNDNYFSNVMNAAVNQGATAEDIQVAKDIYAQMLGRPLKGQNENKFVHFMTNLNPLQTLGQVGFAQASESSLALSRLGVGTVLKTIPALAKLLVGVRKNVLNESDTLLLKDLEALNGPIGEEWRVFKPSTEVMEQLNSSGEIARMTDRILKAGQQVNGYISFMHQVMEAQLKAIAVGASRRFAQEIKAGVLTKRLADAGFTEGSMKRIKSQFDAHAEYRNGELYNMNLSKWNPDDAFDFTTNIERLSGQLIQRDFVGETASWMHGDMGRLFLSLRGYSVKAFNKQLVRNVQIADAVTAQAFIYGTAFSTASYIAKAHVVSLGRDDRDEFLEERLTGAALAQGVIGYVGLGAFGAELLRPLASWAGEAGEAGAVRSAGNVVVAALPGLAPLDRALTLIGNVGTTTGSTIRGSDSNDWTASRTRQAVGTIAGNSLFVALPLNLAVDDE